jgi:hypothetical protein
MVQSTDDHERLNVTKEQKGSISQDKKTPVHGESTGVVTMQQKL